MLRISSASSRLRPLTWRRSRRSGGRRRGGGLFPPRACGIASPLIRTGARFGQVALERETGRRLSSRLVVASGEAGPGGGGGSRRPRGRPHLGRASRARRPPRGRPAGPAWRSWPPWRCARRLEPVHVRSAGLSSGPRPGRFWRWSSPIRNDCWLTLTLSATRPNTPATIAAVVRSRKRKPRDAADRGDRPQPWQLEVGTRRLPRGPGLDRLRCSRLPTSGLGGRLELLAAQLGAFRPAGWPPPRPPTAARAGGSAPPGWRPGRPAGRRGGGAAARSTGRPAAAARACLTMRSSREW